MKELVPEGCFLLERGWWGEAFRNASAFLQLSSCSKVGCPCPHSPWLLPLLALSRSASPQGLAHPCPLLHKLFSPGRPEDKRSRRRAMQSPQSWSQHLLLSPVPQPLPPSHQTFSSCLAAPSLWPVPGSEQRDARAPPERCPVWRLQAPGLGCFWDPCALRTGGALPVHGLAPVRASHGLSPCVASPSDP